MLSQKGNELTEECGDINNPIACRYILGYSPYQMDVPENFKTDVLLIHDSRNTEIMDHTYKFASKLRDDASKDAIIITKDYAKVNPFEKYAFSFSFIIKAVFSKHNK